MYIYTYIHIYTDTLCMSVQFSFVHCTFRKTPYPSKRDNPCMLACLSILLFGAYNFYILFVYYSLNCLFEM